MLHELGHSAYSKNVGTTLPYMLHTDAHPLCTEGVAMMFERSPERRLAARHWGQVPDPEQFAPAAAKLRRNRQLIFSRYCQVMFRFERRCTPIPSRT